MEKHVPENSNEGCPGANSSQAGKEDACKGCPNQKICASDNKDKDKTEDPRLAQRLSQIKHKILVLSGKGGVGKSTVSSQLAYGLAARGFEVGLLDLDLCGPSIPRTMGLESAEVHKSGEGWSPVYVQDNLAVVSIGFLLPNKDDAVIWRGPKKNGLIKQFLTDVDWGTLDFLIVDTPPGTSDEHISIVQYLDMKPATDGAIIVTTSQKLSVNDVRKEINFCGKTSVRVVGIVENMKEFICEHCGKGNALFCQPKFDFVAQMINDFKVEYLSGISFARSLLLCSEQGQSVFDEQFNSDPAILPIRQQFSLIIDKIVKNFGADPPKE